MLHGTHLLYVYIIAWTYKCLKIKSWSERNAQKRYSTSYTKKSSN